MSLHLFFAVFSLYTLTAVPVIYFEDNPMFVTTAYTLGLAHPPGYPLINMLGNLAGALPFGNFAFRCNTLSAIFAAGAVTFFYQCALLLTNNRWLALIFSLGFAISGNLWTQAVIFEVYTLFYALFFFLLWISLSGRLNDFRWLLLCAFLFGLGVTNHVAMSVTLPGFLVLWLLSKERWKYRMVVKNMALALGAGVFSWAVQLYSLIRSWSASEKALFSWGRVESFPEFIRYITGYRTYKDFNFNSAPMGVRWSLFVDYLSAAMPLWGWIILVTFIVLGSYKMFAGEKLKLLSLALLSGGLLVYSLLQYAAIDIMLVIPWGMGMLLALYGLNSFSRKKKRAFLLVCLPSFILLFFNHYSRYDYHNEYSAYDYFSDISDTLPASGFLKLKQGAQMNYILLYGIKGPGGSLSQKSDQTNIFSPYTLPDTPDSYGLFQTSEQVLPQSKKRLLWDHIRSYPFTETGYPELKDLTRNMFKDILQSRVALQRGYSYAHEGEHQKAELLFRQAVSKSASTVFSDAANMLAYGDFPVTEMLLEALLEREVSPGLVRLLGRVKELSEKNLKLNRVKK